MWKTLWMLIIIITLLWPGAGGSLPVQAATGLQYQVQPGDTLWGIARREGVELSALFAYNGLDEHSILQIGQLVRIPASGGREYPEVAPTNTQLSAVSLQWPLRGVISSAYGSRHNAFHHGLDIAADSGTRIKAAAAGTVSYAGWMDIYGYTVIIDHRDGRQTLYAHASQLLVSSGQKVRAGQFISRVGSTGNSTGPHLHFEVRVQGQTINPISCLP